MTKKRHESAHPGRQRLYEGRIIDLNLEHVHLPGGQEVELEIVRHPGGAAVVAIDAEQRVCLLRQFRHAADGWLWELPAGKREPGEEHEVTAQPDPAQDAGVAADRLTSLGIMHSSPGVCTEIIHLYMARDLSTAELNHEHGEVIEVHWEPLSEVLIWCDEGKITDAKTLVGLYRAAALLRE